MQNIFGRPDVTDTSTSYQTGFARNAPLGQSTNGNNGHDSDDDLQITGATTTPHVNGIGNGATSNSHQSEYPSNGEEDIGHQQTGPYSNSYAALSNGLVNDDSDEGEDNQQQTIGHANPYAALADDNDMLLDNDQFGQYNSDADQPGVYPGGDRESGDFEDEDGDIEDEDGEGFDEEGSDLENDLEDEEEYEDEEEDDGAEAHKPSTNAGFAEPEVIELSD
jgi:hypothetical protein